MKIDLTKKPEGATHINPHSGAWVKCFGGNSGSYQFFKDGEWEMGFGCMSNSYLEIAKPGPWTGEGLPPVGTVCEIAASTERLNIRYPEGTVVKVYANFTDDRGFALAAFVDAIGLVGGVCTGECFRPIRTPEQIAQQERERAIEEMDAVFASNFEGHRKDGLQALYDAGYRKQPSP